MEPAGHMPAAGYSLPSVNRQCLWRQHRYGSISRQSLKTASQPPPDGRHGLLYQPAISWSYNHQGVKIRVERLAGQTQASACLMSISPPHYPDVSNHQTFYKNANVSMIQGCDGHQTSMWKTLSSVDGGPARTVQKYISCGYMRNGGVSCGNMDEYPTATRHTRRCGRTR